MIWIEKRIFELNKNDFIWIGTRTDFRIENITSWAHNPSHCMNFKRLEIDPDKIQIYQIIQFDVQFDRMKNPNFQPCILSRNQNQIFWGVLSLGNNTKKT